MNDTYSVRVSTTCSQWLVVRANSPEEAGAKARATARHPQNRKDWSPDNSAIQIDQVTFVEAGDSPNWA